MSEQGSPLIFRYLIYLFPQFVTHSIAKGSNVYRMQCMQDSDPNGVEQGPGLIG